MRPLQKSGAFALAQKLTIKRRVCLIFWQPVKPLKLYEKRKSDLRYPVQTRPLEGAD